MDSAKQATRWWSKRSLWLVPLLVVCIFLLTACASVLPAKMCTLVGCSGGLSIDIKDLPSGADYQVSVTLPSGETITQVCGDTPENSFEKSCNTSGVFIALQPDVSPPESVKIEVVMNGRTYSQEFTPEYEKFQPNGEDCSPICYSADIVFGIME